MHQGLVGVMNGTGVNHEWTGVECFAALMASTLIRFDFLIVKTTV